MKNINRYYCALWIFWKEQNAQQSPCPLVLVLLSLLGYSELFNMVFKALPNLSSCFSPRLNSLLTLELNVSAPLTLSGLEPYPLAFIHLLSLTIFPQPLMHCLTPIQASGISTPEVSVLSIHCASCTSAIAIVFSPFFTCWEGAREWMNEWWVNEWRNEKIKYVYYRGGNPSIKKWLAWLEWQAHVTKSILSDHKTRTLTNSSYGLWV